MKVDKILTKIVVLLFIAFILLFSHAHNISFARQQNITAINNNVQLCNPDSCVAYWNFNEGAINDISQNENVGIIIGAQLAEGIHGDALYFDGNDQIVISDSQSLDITDALTIEVWINALEFFGNGGRNGNPIVTKYENTDIGQYFLVAYGTGNLRFIVTGTNGDDSLFMESNILTEGNWQHIVATWDGVAMKLYVNGSLQSEKITTVEKLYSLEYSDDDLKIGHNIGGSFPNWWFNGIIDEVGIYKEALSKEEIQTRYYQMLELERNTSSSSPNQPTSNQSSSRPQFTQVRSELNFFTLFMIFTIILAIRRIKYRI